MDKQTILVVDDAPENIDLMVALLKRDYIVKAATRGKVALKVAKLAQAPNIILLDIIMPEMDGFEVCRQLKADQDTASIPVIFISGQLGDKERAQAKEVGGIACLSKPVPRQILLDTIEHALSSQ